MSWRNILLNWWFVCVLLFASWEYVGAMKSKIIKTYFGFSSFYYFKVTNLIIIFANVILARAGSEFFCCTISGSLSHLDRSLCWRSGIPFSKTRVHHFRPWERTSAAFSPLPPLNTQPKWNTMWALKNQCDFKVSGWCVRFNYYVTGYR